VPLCVDVYLSFALVLSHLSPALPEQAFTGKCYRDHVTCATVADGVNAVVRGVLNQPWAAECKPVPPQLQR
jgi:hypothetical protein